MTPRQHTLNPFTAPVILKRQGVTPAAYSVSGDMTRAATPPSGSSGSQSEDQVPETRAITAQSRMALSCPSKNTGISAGKRASVWYITAPAVAAVRMKSPRRGCEMVLMVAIAAMSVIVAVQIERILAVRHV
jgi:hypothetical protein